MLVAKVVQDHAADLQLYASEAQQPGFIQKLTDQLTELANANISADDLTTILQQAQRDRQGSRAWLAKMHDVELIYHAYEERVVGHFLGNNELYQQLAQYLTQEPTSQHMHFFIDRFAQFTPGEQQVVNAMIMNGDSTTVSLVLDHGYPDQDHPDKRALPGVTDLFTRRRCSTTASMNLRPSTPTRSRSCRTSYLPAGPGLARPSNRLMASLPTTLSGR